MHKFTLDETGQTGVLMSKNSLTYQICRTASELNSAEDGYKAVVEGLGKNITSKTGDVELVKTVQVYLRDRDSRVLGGVVGHLFGGWLNVSLLWVDEEHRNRGNGTRLLRIIESEAIKLGCRYAHLDTYSFEARPFYEKHGYSLFATLDDYPIGFSKYFLKKKLV